MKKRLSTIITIAIMVIGAGLLLYPVISNRINEMNSAKAISLYDETAANLAQEEREEMLLRAQEYNTNLYNTPGSFTEPDLVGGYEELLDITGTGIMGYIEIEKINVYLPIYHGVSKDVLQVAAGHLEGSSLPVGGENTHCVLSGHRGLPSSKLFTELDELEVGDRFVITVLDTRLVYEVDQISVVLPTETSELQIVPGMDYCTLVTCTPYGINTHRLLVRGVRVEDDGSFIGAGNEALKVDTLIVAPIIASPMLLGALIVAFVTDIKRKKKERG